MDEDKRPIDFWTFLQENKRIEIPKLQRDYAQGRKDWPESSYYKDLRTKFFNDLYDAVKKKKDKILNFIYGSFDDSTSSFLPLDGQQRLTTLFLLYTYAFKMLDDNEIEGLEGIKCEAGETKKDNIINTLQKFTYETRITSSLFCEYLVTKAYTLKNVSTAISSYIKEQNWYYSEFDNDPTVDAMLRSLDCINEIFSQQYGDYSVSKLFYFLINYKSIKFYYLNLEEFKLSDELYIKMNARGKQLTKFESLKSKIQKQLDSGKLKDNNYNFKDNLDNAWLRFIFKIKGEENYLVDTAFMRLFATCIIFNSEDKKILQDFNKNEHRSDMEKYITQEVYNDFCEILNIYTKKSKNNEAYDFNTEVTFWEKNERNYVKDLIIGKIDDKFEKRNYIPKSAEYLDRILFLAHTLYLKKAGFKSKYYDDWMRVVRNFAFKKRINDWGCGEAKFGDYFHEPEQIIKLIKIIKQLSEGCENIYEFLKDYDIDTENSVFKNHDEIRNQITEEIKKSDIFVKESDSEKEKIIKSLEDNELLNGTISFALYCLNDENNKIENVDFKLTDWQKLSEISEFFNKKLQEIGLKKFALAYLACNSEKKEEVLYNATNLYNPESMIRYNLFNNGQDLFYTANTKDCYKPFVKKTVCELLKKTPEEIIQNYLLSTTDKENWIYKFLSDDDKIQKFLNDDFKSYICKAENKYYLIKEVRNLDENSRCPIN